MGAAGQWFQGQPGETLRPAHDFPIRRRRLAVGVYLHPPAACGVLAAEREVDTALRLGGAAFDQSPIGLADPPVLEQRAELGQRLAMAAEDQTTRGIAIEPVGERRLARQPEAQDVKEIFQARSALGAAVHREAGRLVYYQHQGIAIEQSSHHLFRSHEFGLYSGVSFSLLAKPLSRRPSG